MHGSIRNRLENLIGGRLSGSAGDEVKDHLDACASCSSELQAMKEQAALLASLRGQESAGPAAGFYARVMQRIEEREICSIWSVFTDSPFGKRLTFASLTVALALGSYVAAQESHAQKTSFDRSFIAQSTHYDPPVMGSLDEQRDAVLVNFAVHQGQTP